jgi:putative transposase
MNLNRSTFYYEPKGESEENLQLMRRLDEQFLETPYYGSRQMVYHLKRQGYRVGRKRVRRLMAQMGLAVIYPKPRTSQPQPENRVYPYLLRGLAVTRPDQVWCADITYIPMGREGPRSLPGRNRLLRYRRQYPKRQ